MDSLDSRFFQGLNKLVTLQMDYFHIKTIENDTFIHLTNLRSLCLIRSLDIYKIDKNTFKFLDNLIELKLDLSIFSKNRIDDYSFSNLSKLELLEIAFSEEFGSKRGRLVVFHGLKQLKKVVANFYGDVIFPDSKDLLDGKTLKRRYTKVENKPINLYKNIHRQTQ